MKPGMVVAVVIGSFIASIPVAFIVWVVFKAVGAAVHEFTDYDDGDDGAAY